jgi:hypothetical protein
LTACDTTDLYEGKAEIFEVIRPDNCSYRDVLHEESLNYEGIDISEEEAVLRNKVGGGSRSLNTAGTA